MVDEYVYLPSIPLPYSQVPYPLHPKPSFHFAARAPPGSALQIFRLLHLILYFAQLQASFWHCLNLLDFFQVYGDHVLDYCKPFVSYRPMFWLAKHFVSLSRINRPTNSQASAPSRLPIVTSNIFVLFLFVQVGCCQKGEIFLRALPPFVHVDVLW